MTLRCLIIDDNARFADVATAILEQQGLAVVGTASTGDEALRQFEELRPDIALVDIDLGVESGFEVARRLREADPGQSKIIMISTHAAADYMDLIEASAAVGFVSKSDLSAQAIDDVLAGRAA